MVVVVLGGGGLLLVGDVALHGVVLQVVGGCDLGEEGGDHLDDVANGHGADVVLHLLQGRVVEHASRAAAATAAARREHLGPGEGLYVCQVSDMDDGLLLLGGCWSRGRRSGDGVWY